MMKYGAPSSETRLSSIDSFFAVTLKVGLLGIGDHREHGRQADRSSGCIRRDPRSMASDSGHRDSSAS